MNKLFFFILFSISTIKVLASDSTFYVFPYLKVSVNKEYWESGTYQNYLSNLRSYVEIKSRKERNQTLFVWVTPFYSEGDRINEIKEFEKNKEFELNNGKVSYANGFLFSTRSSKYYNGVTVYCNGFYIDSSCRILISGQGTPKDSISLINEILSIIQSAKIVSPAEIDKALNLPLSQRKTDSLVRLQNQVIDAFTYPNHISSLAATKKTITQEQLIKKIKESHTKDFMISSWGKLQPLENLSLDSLIHIQHRYYSYGYYGGSEKLKMVAGLFPVGFSVDRYFKHVKNLYTGNFTLEDVLNAESGIPITIENVFYPVKKGETHGSRIADQKDARIAQKFEMFFPNEEIKKLFITGNKEKLTAEIVFKDADDDDVGFVYFTKQNGRWKSQPISRPSFNKKLFRASQQIDVGNYQIRIIYTNQKDSGGAFYHNLFVRAKNSISSNWTESDLQIDLPSSYRVVFQYHSKELTKTVVNKRLFEKESFGEYFPDLSHTIMDLPAPPRGESVDKLIQKEKQRTVPIETFCFNSLPSQRLYVCEYDLYDLNKDGVQDIVSFTISNGKLIAVSAMTIKNGFLTKLPKDSLSTIQRLPSYQYLIQQSLQKNHLVSQQ